jgi:hypothetical protein
MNAIDIAGESSDAIEIYVDPIGLTKTTLKKAEITKHELSKTSLMPAGLLNNLEADEILDLLAFLEGGGNPDAAPFKAAK